MIISRKRFEQEMQKVRDEAWERENNLRREENMWRAIHDLQDRVDKLEGKNPDENECCRPRAL